MTMPDPSLWMVYLPISMDELARRADDRGWVRRSNNKGRMVDVDFDDGHALHHLLDQTFGPQLRPFRLISSARGSRAALYAYSSQPPQELERVFDECLLPDAALVFTGARPQFKAMPSVWPKDRRLGFECRICPTVRLSKPLHDGRPNKKPFKRGSELDAFLAEALRVRPEVSAKGTAACQGLATTGRTRAIVYRDWLQQRLQGAAQLDCDDVRLVRYQRRAVVRNNVALNVPDAVFQGTLTIEDEQAFAARLAGGVGRHKAYGYGMLLLRPPAMAEIA